MHEIVEIVLHVIYQICHVKNLNIFSGYSYFPLKGEEHLHPQWDVLHSERPPDSDIKGQETGAEGVLQGEDRTALQQHLHVKASIPLEHLNTENLCDRWPALEQMGDTLGLTCFGKKKSNLALLSTRKKRTTPNALSPAAKAHAHFYVEQSIPSSCHSLLSIGPNLPAKPACINGCTVDFLLI